MNNPPQTKTCPQCQAVLPLDAPQGLCPACLLAAVAVPTEAGTAAPTKAQPPTREQVAASFPQLEILELIGAGGMGYVFKARQPKLDRLVALKLLPQSLAADLAFAGRFEREGRILARLSHPNIVAVHDFGFAPLSTLNSQLSTSASGFYYLLMEFVDGVNLRQAMRAGRFTPVQALEVVPKICEALQFAHEQGILHRDIKPENILLDAKGRVKLVDFGIAKLVDDGRDEPPPGLDEGAAQQRGPTTLTTASAALGTPSYMAPEQRDHPADVDHRADIYSLGVVFYEMLTGELPVGKFAPPSAKSASDPRVDSVVLRALEQERERRQQSAGEMKTQVETIASSSGGGRREAAQASGLPPRFLKVSTSTLTTPEQLATVAGQFFHYQTRGQLILDDRQLTHSLAGTNTIIPLAAIRDLSIGQYPRTMNPVGLDLLSVTYEEGGLRKQVLLSPMEGFFGFPATWNARVAEWFYAVRDAIIAATGHAPGNTPAERLGVPSGSKWIFALFLVALLAPLLLGGLALKQLMVVHHGGGSDSLLKTPLAQLLIIWVLSFGALAALGANWLRRRNRGAAPPPGGAPAPAVRKHAVVVWLFAALVAGLVAFATVAAVYYLLSSHETPVQAESAGGIAKVHTEKNKVTIEVRLDGQEELRVFVGEESLGWSVSAYTAGPITATVEASSQIRLENGSLGAGFIFRAGGSTTFVAMTPGGPVPFGKLDFREHKDITAKDGTYTFADIRQADGALVPVSVKVRSASAALPAAPAMNRSATNETWSPTPAPGAKPDLQQIYSEAQELRSRGRYEEALQRHLWLHHHGLEIEPAYSAVRLSFWLADWSELARRYPKAKEALMKIRDHKTRDLAAGRGHSGLFMDVDSINYYLKDEAATLALFNLIKQSDPQLAKQCAIVMEAATKRPGAK